MDVKISNLTLSYGSFLAVKDFSLDIRDGESIVLLGQSGCGKTSTMRCVAGLEEPDSGVVTIGGRDVFNGQNRTNIPANKRNVGMVFQSYAVWPHMTVLDNVSFALKMRKVPGDQVKRKALETLEIVGLAHMADKGASLLSGGQMQRVALARSLAMEPNVMLLDEPLSNLDARLRDGLRVELRRLQLELGLTSIYVTHDQSEALALADRIAIMQDGRIAQLATPVEIYRSPASASIAKFLGVSNVFAITASSTVPGRVSLRDYALDVHTASNIPTGDDLSICIRPEDLRVVRTDVVDEPNSWAGVVEVAVFQGSYVRCTVRLDAGPMVEVLSYEVGAQALLRGVRVGVKANPQDIQILPGNVTER